MSNSLDENLAEWHAKNQFDTIISVLAALPDEQMTDEYLGRLASSYNNIDAYDDAIAALNRVSPAGKETPLWCYRMGYSHYYKSNFETALALFEKSHALGDEDAIHFIQFCKQEMADPGSVDETVHPDAMSVIENVHEEYGYVKIFASDRWTTISFQCDAEAPMAAGRRLATIQSVTEMNGHKWDALIRRFLAVHEPHLLEHLKTDPETGTFAALYPKSEDAESKAQLMMNIIFYLVEEEGAIESFLQEQGGSIAWD